MTNYINKVWMTTLASVDFFFIGKVPITEVSLNFRFGDEILQLSTSDVWKYLQAIGLWT